MLHSRMKTVRFIITIAFLLITIKVFDIQNVQGKQYSTAAAMQQMRNRLVYLERGDILDRNGIRFTSRDSGWKAILQPTTLINNPKVLRTVADILETTVENLKNKLSKSNLPYLVNVSSAQAEAISDASMEGLSVAEIRVRNGKETLAPHIIGYVDTKGAEGMAGIEKAYQTTLERGGGLYAGVLADAGNSFMSNYGYRFWDSTGKEKLDVKLTLDYHMQKIVEDTMDRMVDKGAVVVVDILTGQILAMASRPDFDPSNINPSLNDENQSLYNRALGAYTPGSIFKIVTVAAAMEKGITPDQTFNCPGYVDIGGIRMKCWSYEKGGHGVLNMAQAFAQSCNVYFIELGQKIGKEDLLDMAQRFGLGSMTGLNLQGIGEPAGELSTAFGIPSPGEVGNLSIGQGDLLVSPVQAANMAAVIANGGILNRVSLVDSVVNAQGERIRNLLNPSWKRVIPKDIAAQLQGMMLLTVQSGTGELANIRGFGGSAGKTGSAETGWVKDNRSILHAWFSGYFPTDTPRYSMCVFIEDGKSGASSAAPVFAEISAKIMDAGF